MAILPLHHHPRILPALRVVDRQNHRTAVVPYHVAFVLVAARLDHLVVDHAEELSLVHNLRAQHLRRLLAAADFFGAFFALAVLTAPCLAASAPAVFVVLVLLGIAISLTGSTADACILFRLGLVTAPAIAIQNEYTH